MPNKPCLAITLVYPRRPEYAASYHWCKLDEHPSDQMHECYCGLWWMVDDDDMVTPTPEMILWRTGSESQLKGVSRRLLG
jgi:hypothetical protein